MRRGKSAGLAAIFTASFLVIAACGDAQNAETRAAIAEGCAIDSECSSPLVCAFRACHVQCETSRDCEKYGKANCVQSDKPYRVCQLPNETTCKRNSECPGDQICGPDARCRDACLVDRDCGGGQLCISRVCAEKEELINDTLPGAPPPVVGDACLRASDCGAALVCLFGICTVECVTAKDCDYGLSCIDTRCGVPNVGGAGGRAGSGGSTGGAGGKAGQGGSAAGQAGQGGAGQGGAGQGGASQGGQAGIAGQAGAGGGSCIAGAPCDTGNACELGRTDCTTGVAACVSAGMRPASTVCRAASGVCDSAESCDGTTPTCPPDSRKSAGTECRAAAGACDVAEVCDGATANCPTDALRGNDFACRTSVGNCDAEERCTGADPQCPSDARVGAGAVCRASTGDCDAEELCDGTAPLCPDDALRSAGFTCRAAASSCDVAEVCSGASNSCPIDAFVAIGNSCTGGFCDGAGTCANTCTPNAPCNTGKPCELGKTDCSTGVPKCIPTGPGNAGTVCRAAAGPCDKEDTCSGSSTTCGDDKLPNGTTCRPSSGPCDPAETCDGSAVACPGDAFDPASKQCRAAIPGGCDVAESCTGSTAACPADSFAPATTVCRPSAGFCDVAESCTGSSATCPTNAFQPSSLECRASAGVCDAAESCTGSVALCPTDVLLGASTTCRAVAGECDVAEVCSGALATCPANLFKAVGSACSTGQCDSIGVCAIEQDCTHRWRTATAITGNQVLSSSDKTAVVTGQSATLGARGLGYSSTDGSVAFSQQFMGSFGGRGNTRYGIFYDTSGNQTQYLATHDLSSGAVIASFNHGPNSNYQATIGQSATNQTATQSLVVATASAGAWSSTAGGIAISGAGPAAMLVSHAADGKYQRHLVYSASTFAVTPTALFDGRWAIPIAQPAVALTFGAHNVAAGTNELLVLKSDLSFDRAHAVAFVPSVFAVVTGSNLRIVGDGNNALAAYSDAGLAWSRNDCGGSFLGATSTQVIVATNASGTFCGRPVPAGLGAGMAIAVLDATTGATVSIRWFPTSAGASQGSISISGEPYFLYAANTTVCGASNASMSVVAY